MNPMRLSPLLLVLAVGCGVTRDPALQADYANPGHDVAVPDDGPGADGVRDGAVEVGADLPAADLDDPGTGTDVQADTAIDASPGDTVPADEGRDLAVDARLDAIRPDAAPDAPLSDALPPDAARDPGCTPQDEDHLACCGDAVCWVDSCGDLGALVAPCPHGCEKAACKGCSRSCAGKNCGDDGCGGSCGTCATGKCQDLVWTIPPECVGGICAGGGGTASCSDGLVCTDDRCDPAAGCRHEPNAAACDDGDPCTTGDTCTGGTCRGGGALDCDDRNPCTLDSCVKGLGCRHVNVADGELCQFGACDDLVFSQFRTCSGGTCSAGGTRSCDDGIACTVDACDPVGGCTNTLADGTCLIAGACVVDNQRDWANSCRMCDAAMRTDDWTVLGDGEPCVGNQTCLNGLCGCVRDCSRRGCGDDGCGGDCGPCPEGASCQDFLCLPAGGCTTFPTKWGWIGAVSALQTPADKTVVEANCWDYTGDGKGDNGVKGMAGQLNGPFIDAVSAGELVALFEFPTSIDFTNSSVFTLTGVTGTHDVAGAPGGSYHVDRASYASDCLPVNRFVDARIVGGYLTATSPDIWVYAGFMGSDPELSMPLHLRQVHLKARVVSGGASGVVLADGVLSGVEPKGELGAMVANMQAICDATPAGSKPDLCAYLSVVNSAMALLLDLHRMPDGSLVVKSRENPGDVMSMCLTLATTQASIAGLQAP